MNVTAQTVTKVLVVTLSPDMALQKNPFWLNTNPVDLVYPFMSIYPSAIMYKSSLISLG